MSERLPFRLCLAAALALLAGCSGLHSKDAPLQTYVLSAGAAAAPATPATPATPAATDRALTLAVARPTAASGLDNERIAVIRADGSLDAYRGSRWAGNLPDVLQTLLIDTLRPSGRYRAVLADSAAFGADQLLQVEVRQFQAEYATGGGPPTAHVVFDATLGWRGEREVVRTFHAESRAPAAADRMAAVVAAFNAAVADALSQVRSQAGVVDRSPQR